MEHIKNKALKAKAATSRMACLGIEEKNAVLRSIADALRANTSYILAENLKDLKAGEEKGTSKAMLDRLALSEERIEGMAQGLEKVALLKDPVGDVEHTIRRPNGLMIGKKRVPLGVIGIIYEARPNVTSDAMGLCIKTGNAVVLRGGSDAINSNMAVVKVAEEAAYAAGLPGRCDTVDR